MIAGHHSIILINSFKKIVCIALLLQSNISFAQSAEDVDIQCPLDAVSAKVILLRKINAQTYEFITKESKANFIMEKGYFSIDDIKDEKYKNIFNAKLNADICIERNKDFLEIQSAAY